MKVQLESAPTLQIAPDGSQIYLGDWTKPNQATGSETGKRGGGVQSSALGQGKTVQGQSITAGGQGANNSGSVSGGAGAVGGTSNTPNSNQTNQSSIGQGL